MAATAILENRKTAISQQRLDPIFTKFGNMMQNGFLNLPAVKNLSFKNSRWRTAAILKFVKLRYLVNRLADFDKIWRDDAYWPRTVDRPLKL